MNIWTFRSKKDCPFTVADYLDMVEKRVGSLYGASAEMAAILADDFGSERREALRKFGESIGVVKQLVADYQAIFGASERDPVQQGRIISKKKNMATAFLFDTVKDPSIMRGQARCTCNALLIPRTYRTWLTWLLKRELESSISSRFINTLGKGNKPRRCRIRRSVCRESDGTRS